MGKFVITKRKNAEYQFVLKAGNGHEILVSEGYSSKAGCESGIESVKKNAPNDENYERKTSGAGKFHFNLKAGNGQIIGTSESYETSQGMENGIESVKTNAPNADVEDQTA